MSAEAVGFVYRFSPFTGAAFAVHLAIADSVNDMAENQMWARQLWIATKARVSRKACNEGITSLLEGGFLEVLEDNAKAGKPNRYRFLFPEVPPVWDGRRVSPTVTPGVTHGDTGGVTPGYTEPKDLTQQKASVPTAPASPPSVTQLHGTYPPEFERFWDLWPTDRRGSKRAAYKAWRATVVREMTNKGVEQRAVLNMLWNASKAYLASRLGEDAEFTKLSATFWGPGEHYTVDYKPGTAKPSLATEVPADHWMRGGSL